MVSARALDAPFWPVGSDSHSKICENVGWLDDNYDNYQPSYGTLTTPFLASSAIVPLRRGLPQGRRFAEIPDNMKEKVISAVRSRVNIWVSLKVRYTHLNCHVNLERDNDDYMTVNKWI